MGQMTFFFLPPKCYPARIKVRLLNLCVYRNLRSLL